MTPPELELDKLIKMSYFKMKHKTNDKNNVHFGTQICWLP